MSMIRKDKSIDEIVVGDILKRNTDKENYELKDISKDKSDNEYFHFFGFSIKHRKNLKRHFVNLSGKLEVYREGLF